MIKVRALFHLLTEPSLKLATPQVINLIVDPKERNDQSSLHPFLDRRSLRQNHEGLCDECETEAANAGGLDWRIDAVEDRILAGWTNAIIALATLNSSGVRPHDSIRLNFSQNLSLSADKIFIVTRASPRRIQARQCSRPQVLRKCLTAILRTETSAPLQFWHQEIHHIEQIARRGRRMRNHEAAIFARRDENLL